MKLNFEFNLRAVIYYALALILTFGAMGLILLGLGYNPLDGYSTFFSTPFSNLRSLGLFLVKFTTLYLMGLAFAIPLHSGKFNVGNEGQFLLGGIGAIILGVSPDAGVWIVLLVSALFGLLWALIPATMLYLFNVNEIVSTILLNFISFYLVNYVTLGSLRDEFAGHPMTIPIATTAKLPILVSDTNINAGLIISVIMGIIIFFLISRTVFGYELRATGSNPIAAQKHGINVKLLGPLSLMLGGLFAGLAGGIEVTGYYYRLIEGMHGFYAPLSIILTLMVRGKPLLLFASAFFVSLVDVGSNALQRTMGVPVELSLILLGLIMVLVMIAEYLAERER